MGGSDMEEECTRIVSPVQIAPRLPLHAHALPAYSPPPVGRTPLMPTAVPTETPAPAADVRPAPNAAATLRVVVVNFCQWRNTARLVRQLRRSDAARGGDAGLTVVDNASPPHRAAVTLQRRGVRVVKHARNVGFAAAVNRGAVGDSDWILLLNPDVTVPDGFLDDVLEVIDQADETTGVIGLGLANADGSRQPSTGPFPTFTGTLGGLVRPRPRRKCDAPGNRGDVAWATGGCLLVRRRCLEQLGGFDEAFFLYYEDVDFCRRAMQAGWRVAYDPAATATHHSPLHGRTVPAPLRVVTRHALLTYANRHWPTWQAKLLAGVVWVEGVGRGLLSRTCYRPLRMLALDSLRGRTHRAAARVRAASKALAPIAAGQDRAA